VASSQEYTLSLVVKAQDETQAVFDSIAKNGSSSTDQIKAAIEAESIRRA